MPLVNSAAMSAVRENTKREIAAGKSPAQSYRIANEIRRRFLKKKR